MPHGVFNKLRILRLTRFQPGAVVCGGAVRAAYAWLWHAVPAPVAAPARRAALPVAVIFCWLEEWTDGPRLCSILSCESL